MTNRLAAVTCRHPANADVALTSPISTSTSKPAAARCARWTASRFALKPGERLGLVGESGSGKSTIALALLRMIKPPGTDRQRCRSCSNGELDITAMPEKAMRAVRFDRIALIPQGAMNSLNPVRRIRDQFLDSMRAHGVGLKEARRSSGSRRC